MANSNEMSLAWVLLMGKKFAGKDHFATYLQSALTDAGLSVYRCAFADKVKEHFAHVNGLDFAGLLCDSRYKDQHRAKLIEMAERFKQEFGADFWAKQLIENVPHETYRIVLVTDWRFKEELQALPPGANVITIRIVATEDERLRNGWHPDLVLDNHYSETALDNYTTTLEVHPASTNDHDILSQIVVENIKIILQTE